MASKFLLVAQREYLTRVRKRAFVVLTLLVPFIIAGFGVMVAKIAISDESAEIVDVRDESGLGVGLQLAQASTPQFQFLPVGGQLAAAKQQFQKDKHAGLLYLPAGLNVDDPQGIQLFGKGNIGLGKEERVKKALTDAFAELKMKKTGITQTQLDQLRARVPLSAISLDESGKEKDSNSGVTTILAGGLAIAIYFFIFLYGVQIMRGVGEEKSSRVMEVMLSSVKPFDLMMGKIVGIAGVGLTQFLLWGLLSWGASAVVVPLVLGNDIAKAQTELAAPATSAAPAATASVADQAAASTQQMNPAKRADLISKAFEQAGKLNIPIGTIIVGFLIYFLGGYLLYGALFGAVGAAVDDQTDTQQFMFPITMPLILSYILGFSVILRNPDGPVAFWMSMIPFTSPVAMVIRLPFGVPLWQLALSVGLLIVGFVGTVWVAARIYRVGILMYGKKITYGELSKWLFYKG